MIVCATAGALDVRRCLGRAPRACAMCVGRFWSQYEVSRSSLGGGGGWFGGVKEVNRCVLASEACPLIACRCAGGRHPDNRSRNIIAKPLTLDFTPRNGRKRIRLINKIIYFGVIKHFLYPVLPDRGL